ncbi:hypothetical protein GCM10022403_087520 [Streptomyces coacervatus]|uniref:Prenyltransferase n=1 Tax=Streptomyces coacervatus TaxID=647381 RepID=A0ABP7JDI3_9ACTN|nr:hypothetical protein [Streptomyces coacervatus]MDF2273511.1 hypothetical protein [Streptomyces coacervatus]
MTAIDELLTRSLLLTDPHVPCDVVPYEDTAYPALAPDGAALWEGLGGDLADGSAAQNLQALCEAALLHCIPDQLADFLTDQVPQPRAAWILGCVLQLAGDDHGARFWWQYAAGAGEAAASYSLYLHHLARGDTHAASFWHAQACADLDETLPDEAPDDAPAFRLMTTDTSMPTVLRILSRLGRHLPRQHTQTATAVIDFVSAAVALGYDRNPDCELPLPGPGFAEDLEIIVAATAGTRRLGYPSTLPGGSLPNRRAPESGDDRLPTEDRAREPERLLVEVAAAGDESISAFFKAAVAVCWETFTLVRTGGTGGGTGERRRYYLDRFRIPDRDGRTPPTSATHPSR